MKFTEEKLEKAFTELLGQERFPHQVGASLAGARKPDEVLIEEDLQNFSFNAICQSRYYNKRNQIYYSSTQIPFCF